MKAKIHKNNLTTGLQIAAQFVQPRATTPVLQTVLIDCTGDAMSIEATNLDASIRLKVEAKVPDEGKVCVDARKLQNIIKELPTEDITIETHDSKLLIASGGSRFKLNVLAASDFPPIKTLDEGNTLSISTEAFSTGMMRVSHAASTDENRFILNSVNMEFDDDGIKFTATDGRRLSHTTLSSGFKTEGDSFNAIIPVNFLQKKLNNALQWGENVAIRLGGSAKSALFEITGLQSNSGLVDSILIQTKLIEGKYPNYKQVIPDNKEYVTAEFEKDLLFDVVNRASLVADDKHSKVTFSFSPLEFTASCQSNTYGNSSDSMTYDGSIDNVQVSFNPAFIKESIKAAGDKVRLFVKDEISPAIVKDENFLEVVMPLRG